MAGKILSAPIQDEGGFGGEAEHRGIMDDGWLTTGKPASRMVPDQNDSNAMPKPLDWNQLQDAYGAAAGIPALLRSAATFPIEEDCQSEPWFSLWSALCHQGDVYSASIASVPEIVSILESNPGKATLSFYLLPTSIAIADHHNPVSIEQSIRQEFDESITRLGDIGRRALPAITDPNISIAATAAILVSNGSYTEAEGLLAADS